MRTILTTEDLKNIIKIAFAENSENILLIDEDTGEEKSVDINEYLNITFYNWKDRVIEVSNQGIDTNSPYAVYEDWVQSLNVSMNQSFALVEKIDEEAVASPDIDSSVLTGKITFIIQADKINNLDWYLTKIRNSYLGIPQDIQNSFGDEIKAYIMIGALMFDSEPFMTQLGECIIATCNFRVSYMANALAWTDTKIEISLDGDDEYDATGAVVGTTNFFEMPITQLTWQNIFTTNAVPTANRPDLTGVLATSLTNAKVLTFYDFNKPLTMRFNDIFWSASAYRINGVLTSVRDVNIPVYLRVTSNGKTYVYKDVIDNMEKSMVNSDFNICSISLKRWGKVENS